MNNIVSSRGQLNTAAANLSTRAIVVTQHRVFRTTGWSSFHSGFFGELHPGNEASAVNTEARARNDKCCADR